jgi:hypothetical protein
VDKLSSPPRLRETGSRTVSVLRGAFISVFIAVGAAFVFSCARWTLLSCYVGRVDAEMKLLAADGGSANVADLVKLPAAGPGGVPPHVLNAEEFTFAQEASLDTRYANVNLRDESVPKDQRMAKAFAGYSTWRGMRFDPVAAAAATRRAQTPDYVPVDWNNAWLPYLDERLADNAEPLALAKREAAAGTGYFEHKWETVLAEMPELNRLRTAARLLAMEAAIKAHRGDMSGAMEDVRLGFRLRRLTAGGPVLVGTLSAFSMDSITDSALKGVLSTGQPDKKDIEALLGELDGREEMNRLERAYLGETALGLMTFDAVRKDPNRLDLSGGPIQDRGRAFKAMVDLFWVHTADEASYLTEMRKLREAAAKPYPACLKTPPPPMMRYPAVAPFAALTYMLLPSMSRSQVQAARCDAHLAMVRTALALSLYRSDTGAYPDKLDALVPRYLPALQTDPFDGKPLRYVPREKGYLLYSVGDDGRDNGGAYLRDDLWEMEY